MLTENIPAAIDAIQEQVRSFLSEQHLIVECPNTGDDIEVRFDSQGKGVLRDDDGDIIARFEISIEHSIS